MANNYGGDSLQRLQMNNLLSSLVRKKKRTGRDLLSPGGGNAAPRGGQYQLKPTETISSSLPTAADPAAFQERNKNRALYGKYGKGGLLRDSAVREKELARGKTARQRWEDKLKTEKHGWERDKAARDAKGGVNSFGSMDASGGAPASGRDFKGGPPLSTTPQLPPRSTSAIPQQPTASATPGPGQITVPGIGAYGISPSGVISRPEGVPSRMGGRVPDTYAADMAEYQQNIDAVRGSRIPGDEKAGAPGQWSGRGSATRGAIEHYKAGMARKWGDDWETKKFGAVTPPKKPKVRKKTTTHTTTTPTSNQPKKKPTSLARQGLRTPMVTPEPKGQPRAYAREAMAPIHRAGNYQAAHLRKMGSMLRKGLASKPYWMDF